MPNAKERRWTSSLTNIFLLMITLIKIYQYRETAGYYRSGPALEGTACGRGYKLFSLFFTSLNLSESRALTDVYFTDPERAAYPPWQDPLRPIVSVTLAPEASPLGTSRPPDKYIYPGMWSDYVIIQWFQLYYYYYIEIVQFSLPFQYIK